MRTRANPVWKNARATPNRPVHILALITLSIVSNSIAASTVRYVNASNPTPIAPYTNWATATRTIQNAIDVAVAGDEIVVTNGIYQTGGLSFDRVQTNRVALNKSVLVRSVNGPGFTVIQGKPIPSLTNQSGFVQIEINPGASGGTIQAEGDVFYGGDADSNYGGDASPHWYHGTRCAFVGNGAVLSGFTLADGSAQSGGGVSCDAFGVVTNCILTRNVTVGYFFQDDGFGGGGYGGAFYDCLFYNNTASNAGGGAAHANLFNSLFITNSAISGGGVYLSELSGCHLRGNRAAQICPLACERGSGGGALQSVLHGCTLEGNAGDTGGGAINSTLDHCLVLGNQAVYGGGLSSGFANNSLFVANRSSVGGAAAGSLDFPNNQAVLVHCTVTGNSATWGGGGVYDATFNNCILYNNHAPHGENFYLPDYEFGSTDSLPPGGVGNFYDDPLFVDQSLGNYRLRPDSPCINAGNNGLVMTTLDLDGNPRISGDIVDSGAYEFPLTPRTSLQRLALLIQNADLNPKEKQPLSASLNAATTSFESGNSRAATNQLSALENKLAAQVAPLHPIVANSLITASELAIELITKR